MIFDRIKFEALYPTAQYANERLTVEGTLEPGETVQEAFHKAKKEVEASFHSINPQLSVTQTPEPTVIQREPEPIGDIIAHMKTCTELNVLKTYKLLVKSGTEEEKVYLEMLEKLSTKSQNHECV